MVCFGLVYSTTQIGDMQGVTDTPLDTDLNDKQGHFCKMLMIIFAYYTYWYNFDSDGEKKYIRQK